MKLTEMIITGLLKKGVIFEGRNVDVETTLPGDEKTTVRIKAEHITITMKKEDI